MKNINVPVSVIFCHFRIPVFVSFTFLVTFSSIVSPLFTFFLYHPCTVFMMLSSHYSMFCIYLVAFELMRSVPGELFLLGIPFMISANHFLFCNKYLHFSKIGASNLPTVMLKLWFYTVFYMDASLRTTAMQSEGGGTCIQETQCALLCERASLACMLTLRSFWSRCLLRALRLLRLFEVS